MNFRFISSVATGAIMALVFHKHAFIRLKLAQPGKKIQVIAERVVRGTLNDVVIACMLDVLNSETMGTYNVREELVYEAGFKLATYGSPESCLLAMHLSNYTGVKYSNEITEKIRDAACLFVPGHDSRTVDIVRGKYLYEDPVSI
jgi:hypothetical protein